MGNQKLSRFKTFENTKMGIAKLVIQCIFQAFAVGTFIYGCTTGQFNQIMMGLGTMAMVAIPYLAMVIFKCDVNIFFLIFTEIYAIGPALGFTYKLYYLGFGWDDMLHLFGGFTFGAVGVYLAYLLNKKKDISVLLKGCFAIGFSFFLSGIWEFIEYGIDAIFKTDMQNDSIVKNIYSYLLGGGNGELGSITNIGEVMVNGELIPFEGYIDIGLHDTMKDMLAMAFGTLVFVIIYFIDHDRHPFIYDRKVHNELNLVEKD